MRAHERKVDCAKTAATELANDKTVSQWIVLRDLECLLEQVSDLVHAARLTVKWKTHVPLKERQKVYDEYE